MGTVKVRTGRITTIERLKSPSGTQSAKNMDELQLIPWIEQSCDHRFTVEAAGTMKLSCNDLFLGDEKVPLQSTTKEFALVRTVHMLFLPWF